MSFLHFMVNKLLTKTMSSKSSGFKLSNDIYIIIYENSSFWPTFHGPLSEEKLTLTLWFVEWDLNDQTLSFECIYDIFTITDADLRKHAKTLAELYNVDSNDFIVELLLFRGRYNTKTFGHFSDFAKFVLTSLSNADFPLLQFSLQLFWFFPLPLQIVKGHLVIWIVLNHRREINFGTHSWIYSYCTTLHQKKKQN